MASHFNDYLTVGFQTGEPGFNDGCGSVIRAIQGMGYKILFKGNSTTGALIDALNAGFDVVYRRVTNYGKDKYDYDIPNYDADPDAAALAHWEEHRKVFPPDLLAHKDKVWVEIVNELDKDSSERANWVGWFCYHAAVLLNKYGFKFAGPGWAAGCPEPEHWELPGNLAFLEYASKHPDTCAVAVHEYSLNSDSLYAGICNRTILRYPDIYVTCDGHGFEYPTIIITEFGWGKDNCPNSGVALRQLINLSEIMRSDGVVGTVWTLENDAAGNWKKISGKVNKVMNLVPYFADQLVINGEQEQPEEEEEQDDMTEVIDLLGFIRGNTGYTHVLQCFINGVSSTETLQTQADPVNDLMWRQVKNSLVEEFYLSGDCICRTIDTSPGNNEYYVQCTGEKWGAPWVKRYMKIGELYTRAPLVRWYDAKKCVLKKEALEVTDIKLVSCGKRTFDSGITLDNVVELHWIVGGAVMERYWYALGLGLVEWQGSAGRSYLAEIYTDRPPLSWKLPDCVERRELYVVPEEEEQEEQEEPGMHVIDISDTLEKHATKSYSTRYVPGLIAHVVHHTATSADVTPQAVASYHVHTNDWPGIAYTYWITKDGVVYQVNDIATMSAGVANHNDIYLSTVLPGCFIDGATPTQAQLDTLEWLHNEHIPGVLGRKLPLIGHKECLGAQTTCPGTTWDWKALDYSQGEDANYGGLPREQYYREYWVVGQHVGLGNRMKIYALAAEKQVTVGPSFDDAGIGALDNKKAVLWDIPECDREVYVEWFKALYPGTVVEFMSLDQ